jgi:hypothetical protein
MTKTLVDLGDYHRKKDRAHYGCGHFADFAQGPPPEVGEFMICAVCIEETTVLSIEEGVETRRLKADGYYEEHTVMLSRGNRRVE